jgi:hypothetical protein
VVEAVSFFSGQSEDLLGARREVVHHGVGWEWMGTGSTVSPISKGGIFLRATMGGVTDVGGRFLQFGLCCGGAQGREAFFRWAGFALPKGPERSSG